MCYKKLSSWVTKRTFSHMTRVTCYYLYDRYLHRVVDTCTGQYKYTQDSRQPQGGRTLHHVVDICIG